MSVARRRPPARTVLRALARDLLVLVALLVIAELVLRQVAPVYGQQLFDHDFTGSKPIALNAAGFRGPLVPKEKAPGELRILSLGDSTTFGTGVSVEDTWSAQLLHLAEQKLERKVSVINGGAPAASLAQLTYAYEHVYADYHPDFVVALISDNFVSFGLARQKDPPGMPYNGYAEPAPRTLTYRASTWAGRLLHRFCLPSFLTLKSQAVLYRLGLLQHDLDPASPIGPLLAHGYRQADVPASKAEEGWRLLGSDLQRLNETVSAHGATLIVAYLPPRFLLSDDSADNPKAVPRERLTLDASARFHSITAAAKIPSVDVKSALLAARNTGDPLYIVFDYLHLDPTGHKALAGAVLNRIAGLQHQGPPLSHGGK